jgi:hypothetical protein
MDNELIIKQSWFKKNWKWFLPITLVLFLLLFGFIVKLSIDENVTEIIQAYSDKSLYENAIKKANSNNRVLIVIGEIEPIDKLALLEGNAIYSNNNNSVELSFRVKGKIGKGKMDISAYKVKNQWHYKNISIRVKKPEEKIQILKDTPTARSKRF